MTSQTKTFVEASDIVALRLQCKGCQCFILVEAATDEGTINNSAVYRERCPGKVPGLFPFMD